MSPLRRIRSRLRGDVASLSLVAFVCSPSIFSLAALVLLLLLALSLPCPATNNSMAEALQWIDRLQERLAHCRDYQCLVTSYERKGCKQEERSYRLFVKDSRLVRVKVTDGRGKGSEAVLEADGRIRGRKGGLLKNFAQTLKPDDDRIRSLRGTPFWNAACHNFLKELRVRLTQPGTQCELEPDTEQVGRLLLVVNRPGSTREKYWIDPQKMHVMKGEVYEEGLLVQEFAIREVKENLGLNDDFFSF
jgi:outer membrane lipoprotein-sorting protein